MTSVQKFLLTSLASTVTVLSSQTVQAQSADTFAQCLNRLAPAAYQAGVSPDAYQRYTQGLQPDLSLLKKLNYQPEFETPIWDYIASLVDERRVIEGQQKLHENQATLNAIEQQYGVDPAVIVAVWGVESNFGKNFGKHYLPQALGTLSCYGRRQAFFQGEFFATLRILQAGDIAPDRLKGSWAGAFGHTQFMPSAFERLAVDFDGDGRRDIIDSTPDALASTANYLHRSGWQTGQPWGFEVVLPLGFNPKGESRKNKHSLDYWQSRGLTGIHGEALSQLADPSLKAGLLLPAGTQGPAFLVFKNFDVIYSYNAAESYALAIAHLSDRIKGGQPFVTPWPTDDLGLSRAQRQELQQILINRGHDIGEPDGIIGDKTRQAIQDEESRLGLPISGRAGQKIYKALKEEIPVFP